MTIKSSNSLLESALNHRLASKYDLAMADLRLLLQMDPTNLEAKQELTSLINHINSLKDSETNLTAILKQLHAKPTLEVAQKLATLTITPQIATQLLHTYGFAPICSILQTLDLNSHLDIFHHLVITLNNCSKNPTYASKSIQELLNTNLLQITLTLKNLQTFQIFTEAVALLLKNIKDLEQIDAIFKFYFNSIPILKTNPNGILMINNVLLFICQTTDKDTVKLFYKYAKADFFRNVEENELRAGVVAVLARSFEYVEDESRTALVDDFILIITNLLQTSTLSAAKLLTNFKIAADMLTDETFDYLVTEILTFPIDLQIEIVQFLSTACSNPSTRTKISSKCSANLVTLFGSSSSTLFNIVSLTLIKLMNTNPQIKSLILKNDFKLFFKNIIENKQDFKSVESGIESLGYLTINHTVKNTIAADRSILDSISAACTVDNIRNGSMSYGIAMIYSNLTNYPVILTEEQQQLKKLKDLSMAVDSTDKDEVETTEKVNMRIDSLVKSSLISNLGILGKSVGLNTRELVSTIYKNVATVSKNRGELVQSGSVKTILTLYNQNTPLGSINASSALSKICISSDPNLCFRGQLVFELIKPLCFALGLNEDKLSQFEALLALTNLCSMENDLIRSKVIEEGYKKIIELQFSDNVMIRRASTECLSNLIQELKLFETYCCNENNLKIMIALMDDEDFATRRAASGAIAMLTSFDKNLEIIMKNPRVFEILHELLEDESDEIVHRAMVICKNCCMARNEKKLEFLPIVLKLNEHGNGSISFLAKTTLDAIMKE